jgi:hypothetical protein
LFFLGHAWFYFSQSLGFYYSDFNWFHSDGHATGSWFVSLFPPSLSSLFVSFTTSSVFRFLTCLLSCSLPLFVFSVCLF